MGNPRGVNDDLTIKLSSGGGRKERRRRPMNSEATRYGH